MESPQNKRISNRRKGLKQIWKSKEWLAAKKEFLSKNPKCIWCGSPSVVPHHPYKSSYGDTTYIDLYLSGAIAMCQRCHFSIHHNLILCPVCKTHYMRLGADKCYGCYVLEHPEILELREAAKERRKRERREYAKKKRQEYKEKHDKDCCTPKRSVTSKLDK